MKLSSSEESRVRRRTLRAIALTELLKGAVVVIVGLGLVSLARHNIEIEDVARSLVYVLHANPHRHLWEVFIKAAARLDDANLLHVAIGAGVYSLLRFVEAYGLWMGRIWAEWLALVSGAIYLPLEVVELTHRATPLKWLVLLINLAVVLYMAYLRLRPKELAKAIHRTHELPPRAGDGENKPEQPAV